MKNRIREDLAKTGVSLGSWLNLASPLAAEILAAAGLRWLCVDVEHSPVGLAELTHQVRAIEARGAVPLARLADCESSSIATALDAGVYGIVAPHMQNVEQAQRLVEAAYYPPRGYRSSGASRAKTISRDYAAACNDQLLIIAQIEDRQGVDNADAIMAMDGIDGGFLGNHDLALDMGLEMGCAEHEAAVDRVRQACEKAGKPCGILVKNEADFRHRLHQGYALFSLSSDLRLMQASAGEFHAAASSIAASAERRCCPPKSG